MKTKVAIIKNLNEDKDFINEAGNIIKSGGTVAFPTETVYGLGADALNGEAVKKIFLAKGRPQDNPLIIHVSSKKIEKFVKDVPPVAEKLMDKFWPGPMTIILNKKDIVPDETSAGLSTIGVRMPNSEIALKLIEAAGVPIAAPSANISGRPSPTDVERCIEDLDGKIDYILGGERSDIGVESTIVDCTVNPPMVLRPGGITLEMLRTVDENIVIDEALKKKPSADLKPKAPGMKYRHYAPKAKLKIISGKNEKTVEKMCKMLENYIKNNSKVAIITTDENIDRFKNCEVLSLGRKYDLNEIAKNLFETLRKCDDLGVQYILCQGFEENGVGLAIMNRLNKAAGYDILEV